MTDETRELTAKDMRGWGRIKRGSTRLSTFVRMRRTIEKTFQPWSDSQPCMWEIVVRVPPDKKKARKR